MLWLKKYDDLMFSSFDNKNNVNDAMQLKNDNLPKVIYKYREFSDQTFDALMNDRLYLPAIENLNDPYEGELLASVDELWKHMLVAAVTDLDGEIGNIVEQGLAQIDSREKGYEFVRYAVQAFDFDNKYTVVHKRFNEDTLGNLFRDIEKS